MREIKDNLCGRAEDLIAYLYGETTDAEAKDFKRHAQECASCRTELSAFSSVRQAIGDWRQATLGPMTSQVFQADETRDADKAAKPVRTRSALAALREFFTLSPAWMRASVVAMSLLFCALAAIAVAYFVRRPETVVVEKTVKSGYSDEEVKAKVAEAMKNQQQQGQSKAAQREGDSNRSSSEVLSAENKQPGRRPRVLSVAASTTQLAKNNRRPRAAPRSDATSSELASTDYLPFTASVEEETLPTLVDLVNDDE